MGFVSFVCVWLVWGGIFVVLFIHIYIYVYKMRNLGDFPVFCVVAMNTVNTFIKETKANCFV